VLVLDAKLERLLAERKEAEDQVQYCLVALNDAAASVTKKTSDIDAQLEVLSIELKAANDRIQAATEANTEMQAKLQSIRQKKEQIRKSTEDMHAATARGITASHSAVSDGDGVDDGDDATSDHSVDSVENPAYLAAERDAGLNAYKHMQTSTFSAQARGGSSSGPGASRQISERDIELESIDFVSHHRAVLESSRSQLRLFEAQHQDASFAGGNHDSLNLSMNALETTSFGLLAPLVTNFASFLTDGAPPPPSQASDAIGDRDRDRETADSNDDAEREESGEEDEGFAGEEEADAGTFMSSAAASGSGSMRPSAHRSRSSSGSNKSVHAYVAGNTSSRQTDNRLRRPSPLHSSSKGVAALQAGSKLRQPKSTPSRVGSGSGISSSGGGNGNITGTGASRRLPMKDVSNTSSAGAGGAKVKAPFGRKGPTSPISPPSVESATADTAVKPALTSEALGSAISDLSLRIRKRLEFVPSDD
jgi:hypothetical protein